MRKQILVCDGCGAEPPYKEVNTYRRLAWQKQGIYGPENVYDYKDFCDCCRLIEDIKLLLQNDKSVWQKQQKWA